MKTETLSLDLLRIDGDTQSRLAINEDAVADYCELIQEAGGQWPFPPLDVFFDGSEYFVADGFHRKLGAVRAKRSSVPCNVHEGTATDARIFGMTANDRNGLRMTPADKKHCVAWLTNAFPKMTQREIGEKTGLSTRRIKQIVAEFNAESLQGKLAAKVQNPSKGSGKGKTAPHTPDRGGKPDETSQTEGYVNVLHGEESEPDDDREPTDDEIRGAASDPPAPASGKPKPEPKPVKALEGREADAFDARQTIDGMMKTIDQWVRNVNWRIDRIREEFPSPTGDEVLKHLQATYAAMKKWKGLVK
jgi:hypothetical protein